jgi:hypothetical protein
MSYGGIWKTGWLFVLVWYPLIVYAQGTVDEFELHNEELRYLYTPSIIYLFMVYLTTLLVAQIAYRRIIG